MFLTRVRLGLFERDLAHRFDVSVTTVSDVLSHGQIIITYYILLEFACVAFKRKDKGTLGRYLGRISDKEIEEKSKFCQLIETGDQYLADKGFEIHDLLALRGGSLYISPRDFLPLTSSQKANVSKP